MSYSVFLLLAVVTGVLTGILVHPLLVSFVVDVTIVSLLGVIWLKSNK